MEGKDNNRIDPHELLGTTAYVRGTDVCGEVLRFKYIAKENRCLVRLALGINLMDGQSCFTDGPPMTKEIYTMCEELEGIKSDEFVDSTSCGAVCYKNCYTRYVGWFDIKNVSKIPFGTPLAQLLYGD